MEVVVLVLVVILGGVALLAGVGKSDPQYFQPTSESTDFDIVKYGCLIVFMISVAALVVGLFVQAISG